MRRPPIRERVLGCPPIRERCTIIVMTMLQLMLLLWELLLRPLAQHCSATGRASAAY